MTIMLRKIGIKILLVCIPIFIIIALFIDGEGNPVLKQIKEDKAIFQKYVSKDNKEMIQRYIESEADKTGPVSHNKGSSILLLWGGNKNNGLSINNMYQYRDREFNDAMKSLGFEIVNPTDPPSSIILVYRNGTKVREYGSQKIIGYRNDKHFVYFDLENDQIVNLGSVEGQALPETIIQRSKSNVTTYFGDEASNIDQMNFLRTMLRN